MTRLPGTTYSISEVEALVELYTELEPVRHQLRWLVRLADLDLAMARMPPKEYEGVLLIGLIGLDTRWAGKEMGVDPSTVWRRYRRGLVWLTNYLNGVTPQGLHRQGGR